MELFLHYFLPPLIGALIGYVTNWIAVKMLFRPLYPKRVGKFRLPFTPGIIPRRKAALAKAIGKAVGEELLTKEDIFGTFSSEERKTEAVVRLSDAFFAEAQKDVGTLASEFLSETEFREKSEELAVRLSDRILAALPQLHIGETVAKVAGDAVSEKLKGSPLGMFVGESAVRSVAGGMSGRIDEYIAAHGEEKILPVIRSELAVLFQKPVSDLLLGAGIDRKGVEGVVSVLYSRALLPAVEEAAASFDVAAEVEKKIAAMDVKELETLCLSVMKKELNAITWLGGLIGLLLGIVNIFL